MMENYVEKKRTISVGKVLPFIYNYRQGRKLYEPFVET